MKNIALLSGLLICLGAPAVAQEEVDNQYVQQAIGRGKQYLVVFFKEGPNKDTSPEDMEKVQEAHLKYLFTLNKQGRLPIFGPFFNSGELRGLCIFNSNNQEEVKQWMDADPHVKAGHLTYEINTWFSIPGSALP